MLFTSHGAFSQQDVLRLGEVMKYKVHYGFITAAEAEMTINQELETVNGAKCYAVEVKGRSVGMFDLFMRIRDTFGTYIDANTLVPQKFYRKIEEGNYRKHEIVKFDRDSSQAHVRNYSNKKKAWKPIETFEVPATAQDLVSAYYFLRTLDYSKYKKGEIIIVPVFFDDELVQMQVRYLGVELVRTKLGKMQAMVMSPIMPKNKLFDGENSIRVWISNDDKKIPLKVKASMFVGAVEIDILKYHEGKQ